MKAFYNVLILSGLKPNNSKCSVAGIRTLKGASLALCGIDCINLSKK